MELNMGERFSILQILPEQGNFVTLKVLDELRMALAPSSDETTEYEIITETTGEQSVTKWNQKGIAPKEIEISTAAKKIISDKLKEIDKAEKLTKNLYSSYEKFVEGVA
jgi:hypothetical protein